ncbi:Heat shock protein beta-11 [Coelomomyces lativittatus]|nr:Heat shock protein beta-11 [Coelomomyces lativittatus]
MTTDYEVIFASSQDPRFPANDILKSDPKLFWTSTGLYPQEIILQVPTELPTPPTSLQIKCFQAKTIQVLCSDSGDHFELVYKLENLPNSTAPSSFIIPLSDLPSKLSHFKISITEGHDHFMTIHSLKFT